jgi:hypothetical protein
MANFPRVRKNFALEAVPGRGRGTAERRWKGRKFAAETFNYAVFDDFCFFKSALK